MRRSCSPPRGATRRRMAASVTRTYIVVVPSPATSGRPATTEEKLVSSRQPSWCQSAQQSTCSETGEIQPRERPSHFLVDSEVLQSSHVKLKLHGPRAVDRLVRLPRQKSAPPG